MRLYNALTAAGAVEMLREAAGTIAPDVATIARGALANVEQLTWIHEDKLDHNGEPSAPATPRPPDIPGAHRAPPAPPASADGSGGDAGVDGLIGVSHRALPQLCQQLMSWNPTAARRRGVAALAKVLSSRSLDPGTALELLRRGDAVTCLLDILYPDDSPAAAQLADCVSDRGSGGRIGPPPAQTDVPLRDGALHLLALIAHLGGLELLQPVPRIAAALGGALVASEPSVRALAATFWRAATVWETFGAALAKAVFPLGAVRAAGMRVESPGAFTNGIAVVLALAKPPADGSAPEMMHLGVLASIVQEAAAGALANTLLHDALRPLWTTAADTLAYLVKLDDKQVARLRALPAQMARRENAPAGA